MTSPSAQLQQPAKPQKYRAPVAPTADHTHTDHSRPASDSVDTIEQHLAACVKYRAPAPPTPPPSSTATSAPVANNNMRREPMQVLRTNSYNNNDVTDTPLSRGKHSDDVITAPTVVTGNVELDVRSGVTSVHDVVKPICRVADDNDDRCRKNCVTALVGDGHVILEKPVVSDVKLLQRSSNVHLHQKPTQVTRSWRSTESIDKLNVLLGDVIADRHVTPRGLPQRQTSSSSSTSSTGGLPRSSFVDPNNGSSHSGRRSVYIDLGEYQTLLKHGKEDAVYSLPQPQCYGDETLRAVKLITEKYDTFKRRQLRALSFRDGVVRPGYQHIYDGTDRPDRIIEGYTSTTIIIILIIKASI